MYAEYRGFVKHESWKCHVRTTNMERHPLTVRMRTRTLKHWNISHILIDGWRVIQGVSRYRRTERVLPACLLGGEYAGEQITILSQKKKKKPWRVISFIIRPLFNIDRSMKWKARVKWDKTSFHPRWKLQSQILCNTHQTFAHSPLGANQQAVFEWNLRLSFITL